VKRPKITARSNGHSINLTLTFSKCRPTQIPGQALWKLVDCDCRANFKVQIGEMEICPRIICKVILSAKGPKGDLHLARQAANKAVYGEALPP